MDAWWKTVGSDDEKPNPERRAVAYYRHSAQDRQENSIPLQQDQVRAWARSRGLEIIREFADHGKSGLSVEDRDAFTDMLENWVKKRDDFRYVLVLDVSRWGRFQDIDLSATYSAFCTQSGKKVVYTTLGLPEKDDPLHAILVGFERFRAAQYSRELSDKVARGREKIAEQGFWSGGYAPYGFTRLLLDEARSPVQTLRPAQRKAVANQRVTLAPGDPREIAVVRRIFDECATREHQPLEIARGLNGDGIPAPGGGEWTYFKVRRVLTNELYIGTIVYNKTTKRLRSPARNVPRKDWIRTPAAFPPLISRPVFDRAQALVAQWRRQRLPETKLENVGIAYREVGTLSKGILESRHVRIESRAWPETFRSIGSAFQGLFPELRSLAIRSVHAELRGLVGRVEEHEDFLVLDRRLSVVIQPSVPIPSGIGPAWPFSRDPRPVIDLTLGVILSGAPEGRILGYLALPRLLVSPRAFRLHGSWDWRIQIFGHKTLDFIPKLLSNGGAYGPPAAHERPALRDDSGGPDRGAQFPGSGRETVCGEREEHRRGRAPEAGARQPEIPPGIGHL